MSKSKAPTIGDVTINCPSTPCKVQEEITIQLTGSWYSIQPTEMELWISISLELTDGTRVMVVPEQWDSDIITFILPVLSEVTNPSMAASIVLTAYNVYDNYSVLIKPITIDNTLSDPQNVYPVSLNDGTIESATWMAAQIKLLLKPPVNGLNGPAM